MKAVVEFGCASVMIICFVSSFLHFTSLNIQMRLRDINDQLNSLELNTIETKNITMSNVIETGYSEYIISEAGKFGISLDDVIVTTQLDENGLYMPISVVYFSNEEVTTEFMEKIVNDLGIPQERQMTNEN